MQRFNIKHYSHYETNLHSRLFQKRTEDSSAYNSLKILIFNLWLFSAYKVCWIIIKVTLKEQDLQ